MSKFWKPNQEQYTLGYFNLLDEETYKHMLKFMMFYIVQNHISSQLQMYSQLKVYFHIV